MVEKHAALMTEEHLTQRGTRASRERFDAVLAKIPHGQPDRGDELPSGDERTRVSF